MTKNRVVKERCCNCGRVKPLSELVEKDDGFGRYYWCKACEESRGNEPRKACLRCGRSLGFDYFLADNENEDGMSAWCKPCCCDYAKLNTGISSKEASKIVYH